MIGFVDLNDLLKITSIIIILVGLIRFKAVRKKRSLQVLLCLFIVSIISDVIGSKLYDRGIHNIWLFNLYNLIEFSLLSLFFLIVYERNRQWNIILGTLYMIALIAMTYIAIDQSFTENFNSTVMGLESIILICSAVYYFRLMLSKLEYDTPWANPYFWINSGILLYFSGGFFIFIFSDYRESAGMITLWDIHNIIHIFYNLLITIGFWKTRNI